MTLANTSPPYVPRGVSRWGNKLTNKTLPPSTSHEGSAAGGTNSRIKHSPPLHPTRGQPVGEPTKEKNTPPPPPYVPRGVSCWGNKLTNKLLPPLHPTRGQPVGNQLRKKTLPPYVPRGFSRWGNKLNPRGRMFYS